MAWKPPEDDEVIDSGWTPPETDETVGGAPSSKGGSFLDKIAEMGRSNPATELGAAVGRSALGLPGEIAGRFFGANPENLGTTGSAPMRGYRGVAVGAQRIIEGDAPSQALNRASAAVQPGYQPPPGEKLGAFIGTALPLAPLGIVPGAIAAGIDAGSENLAVNGNPLEAIYEAGKTGTATLALGGALKGGTAGLGLTMEYGGKALSASYRSLIGGIKGVGRTVVDEVFDVAKDSTPTLAKAAQAFFDKIGALQKTASDKLTKAQGMPVKGATPDEIAKSAVEMARSLREQAFEITEKAKSELSTEPTVDPNILLSKIDEFKNTLTVKGRAVGDLKKRALETLNRWASDIKEITRGTPGSPAKPSPLLGPDGKSLPGKPAVPEGKPVNLSELELKDVIQSLGGDTVWEGPADDPVKKVLRPLYGELRSLLEHKESFAKSHEMIDAAESIEDAFGLAREAGRKIVQTDQTLGRVRGMIGGKREVSKDVAEKLGFSDLIKSAKGRVAQEEAKALALKEATKAAKVKYPSDVNVYGMAEAAARSGIGSPQHLRLERTLQAVLGEKDGSTLARDVITSAAKDIFARRKGSAFTGMSIQGLASAGAGEATLSKLKAVDDFFKKGITFGKSTQRVAEKIPSKGWAGILYGREKSE